MNRTRWYFTLLPSIAALLAICGVLLTSSYGGYPLACRLIIPILILSVYTSAACVSWIFAVALSKRVLPSIKMQDVSSDSKTVVVIPCLLSSFEIIDRLIENLRNHYYANICSNVSYHLLSDYKDADERVVEGDAELLSYTLKKIDELNGNISNVFGLINRFRTWSPTEMVWMGRERKRGKLEELNQYLLGQDRGAFDVVHCDPDHLKNVQYVITVDADTMLPCGSVISLIGTISHPENHKFDLIQPGVGASPGEPVNIYQWIMFPLFPPLSVFQDLFGKTKYVGKGIYSVQKFHSKLAGQFPEGWVLSHDVLESCFLSVGSSEGAALYEKNPETVAETMSRLHRWYRGDWQSLPWVLPGRVRQRLAEFRDIRPQKLTHVEVWRLLELMFGSLQAPAKLFLLLLAGPEYFLFALVMVLTFDFTSSGMVVLSQLARGNKAVAQATIVRIVMRQIFSLFLLPAFGKLALDAIIRALFRMFVSKRFRLEWSAFAEWKISSKESMTTPREFYPNYVVGGFLFVVAVIAGNYFMATFSLIFIAFPLVVPIFEKTRPPVALEVTLSNDSGVPPIE
jgi:cellulose synthase/poly-beta-1,6-N-acetylglucosamine synthase-like glycosyltransferase